MIDRRRPERPDRCKKGSCRNLLLVEFDVLFDVDVEIIDNSVEVEVIDIDAIDGIDDIL
ncbi:MAG: hypothetical protein ACOCQO_01625 [Halanaerobiaceae bacterium]